MKTFLLDPTVGDRSTAVVEEVDKLLQEGKQVVVTVVDETKRFEDLRDGRIGRRELGSLRDLTTVLVEAPIVAGLTRKQLGERLGVDEQQIQRWEANLYSGVGVERLQEVVDALGMEVKVIVGRPRRKWDRNFAVAGNFERIDPDSRPVSEIPDDANGPRG